MSQNAKNFGPKFPSKGGIGKAQASTSKSTTAETIWDWFEPTSYEVGAWSNFTCTQIPTQSNFEP